MLDRRDHREGRAVRIGSLFSGAGGLDMAVESVFAGRTVWHSEIDNAASKVLAHRWTDVPNLGSVTDIDWATVPPVDVLCGGFPCQDVSAAGKRAGIKEGTRSGLWSVFAEAIDVLRPQWVVVENVRGLLSATAHRTEVDDERNCICGGLDRWRGLHRLGRQGEAWEGADVPGAGDGGNDDPGHRRVEVAERAVGRISAQLAQGYGRLGVRVDVDSSGVRCTPTASTDCALLENQIGSSTAGLGGGADQSRSSSEIEWYGSGMELARACRVRGDQDENAFLERQGAKCQSCGGFLPSVAADSDLEPSKTALGNGGDGSLLRAAGAVCGTLADLGYDAQWATVAAADVGAPHRRERVFIVATAADREGGARDGLQQQDLSALCGGWDTEQHGDEPRSSTPADARRLQPQRRRDARDMAAETRRCQGPGRQRQRDGDAAVDSGATAADTPRNGRHEGRPESARLERGFDAAVSGDEPGVALLPTPTQSDGTGGGIRTGLSWEGTTKSTGDGGNSRLRDVAGLLGGPLLPTPNAQGGNGGGRYSSDGHQKTLPGEARLLPTPQARDHKGTDSPADHNRRSPGMDAVSYHFPALLPTPEAKNSHAGPDYARMNREGSGGHDLVTALTLLCTPSASDGAGGKTSRSGGRIDEPLLGGQAREMQSSWGKYAPAIHRWEQVLGRPAPPPTEPNKNGNPRLAAAFSQWLMGWPAGWVTDPAIGISRNDQLRIVGNGVCPQQAIAALRYLLSVNRVSA